MDHSEVVVSQEGKSTFQKGVVDKRQHCPKLNRRQRQRLRIATYQNLTGYSHRLGIVKVSSGKILSAICKQIDQTVPGCSWLSLTNNSELSTKSMIFFRAVLHFFCHPQQLYEQRNWRNLLYLILGGNGNFPKTF